MHWPELHTLFGHSSENCSSESKRQNVINNPHITDWFFTERLENFVKHWLYKSLDAEWHWYRFEYQARGSIHCHGVAKLKNDPGLCQLSETALKGFLAEESMSNEQADIPQLNEDIIEGKKASQTICDYVDWLLSTYNPDPPGDETWIKPTVHPCKRRHCGISTDTEMYDDYVDLLNTVQRHTRCSTAYCLRKKPNHSDFKCRFGFPFETCVQTKLEFEAINTKSGKSQYKAKVVTKRNDPRLNNHQRLQLQGWRANCDIQAVIDYHACVEYLTKYASKGEPRSLVMKDVFNSLVNQCNNNTNTVKLVKKIVMKSLGQRDYSAQETMHHLMSLKLVSSSFKVVPISLNSSRRIKAKPANGDVATHDSILDTYAKREKYTKQDPEIMELNFINFVKKYKTASDKLVNQQKNIIPRVFPVYSTNVKGPNFPLYCKYQLLKYKPWHTNQDNAWGDQEGTDQVFVNKWKEFLESPAAKTNVPDWYEKLQNIQSSQEQEPENEQFVQPIMEKEDWMLLADLVTGKTIIVDRENERDAFQTDFDWQIDKVNYEHHQIAEMPSWIKTKKDIATPRALTTFENINVDNFSGMQRHAYDIVKTHSKQTLSREPLLFIVVGVAGTGKSYLINAIRYLLQTSCAVTATTGKAAFNIGGSTIHSLLKLPVGNNGYNDLTGQSLVRLQNGLQTIKYIIIDEFSMLGQSTFGWIDRRCRQATGKADEVFGGKSIILVGDPAQMPPVADKPLYHSRSSGTVGEQGRLAYYMFDIVVKLSVNQRVQGSDPLQSMFRDLLMRLRTGDSSEEDWELLLSRQPSKQHINLVYFQDATRLYYGNEEVAQYNHKKLSELNQPIACINAYHSSNIAKKATTDEMSGLQPQVCLAKGARVMLTMNLWTDVGLCNGATGTVIHTIYANSQQPSDLPVAVIVKFDDYQGPSISDTFPACVPITPITVTSHTVEGLHERQQLPLKLAWAMTIHKSQGLTLTKAWIDIGQTERTAGAAYVAISRVRTLSSCIIEPMTFERLKRVKYSSSLKFRLEEEMRLDELAKNCLARTCR